MKKNFSEDVKMDKLTEREEPREHKSEAVGSGKRRGFFKNLGGIFTEVKEMARRERIPIYDLLLFSVGFLFAGCHLFFGAYPLGIALVASLSFGVWGTLIGAVAGALTLGRQGVIFAIVTVITVFIRVIISGGETGEERTRLFSENLLLRMCSAVIGGFVSAVYELLLSGLSEGAVLFGVSMILLPPVLTFMFSGIFFGGFSVSRLIRGSENILSLSGKGETERYNILFFEGSALAFLFFVTLSLENATFVGISFSFVFLDLVALLVARRFGALRALTVGFVASLGVSGIYSVSFGLLGLVAGGLFGFGLPYGIIGGGIAALLWGFYSSGLTGLLSVLPEYSIAAILAFPLLKRLSPEQTVTENAAEEKSAKDMIGTMALVYQKKLSDNLDALESALGALSEVTGQVNTDSETEREEYREIVLGVAEDFCESCPGKEYCKLENVDPCVKNAERIVSKMLSGERILPDDVNLDDEFCQYPEEMAAALSRRAAMKKRENCRREDKSFSECYGLISALIKEARSADESERSVNGYRSDQLERVVGEFGFGSGASKVFGDRRLHLFVAAEDAEGERISSPTFKAAIEEGLSVRLCPAEFYRREKMVLMECSEEERFAVEYREAKRAANDYEGSGDTLCHFKTEGGMIYSLISDGMGRGRSAREVSSFTADFLRRMLEFSSSGDGVLHLLNRALRQRRTEASVTVDLFGIDSYSGEVTFLKSGAAPSYVKRDGSIFRIRSKTAPLGILSTVDTERIKVEVRVGDTIIMLSDGICAGAEEAAWLLELLAKPCPKDLGAYAEMILSEAIKNSEPTDDMSVIVMKICEKK